jgi:hypothetical protein
LLVRKELHELPSCNHGLEGKSPGKSAVWKMSSRRWFGCLSLSSGSQTWQRKIP